MFAVDEDLDPEELIGRDLFDIATKSREVMRWFEEEAGLGIDDDDHPHDHAHSHDPNRHGDDIRAFSFVFDEPIDWTAFGLWLSALLNRHGEAILRVKGILSIAGESAPVAVNGVQQLVHAPTHLASWPTDDRRTRIVFICKGLDEEPIRRSFSAFVLKQKAHHIFDLQYRRALRP